MERETFLLLPSNPQLDLSRGRISRDIDSINGGQLQRECQEKYPQGIKHGEIAVTGLGTNEGYSPMFKHILHCCLVDTQAEDEMEKAIRDIISESLGAADRFAYPRTFGPTLLIPALGLDESCRYDAHVVVKAMYGALMDYGRQHQNTTIKNVYIGLLPWNEEYEKIFEAEEERYYQAQRRRIAHETRASPTDSPLHELRSPDGLLVVTTLNPTSWEYKMTRKHFLKSFVVGPPHDPGTDPSDLIQIVSIERIFNETPLQRYLSQLERILWKPQQSVGLTKGPLALWHGTNRAAADDVMNGGFNNRFCERPNFGEAVFFTSTINSPGSQADAGGENIVFYCRVLVGRCVQAHEGLRFPSTQDAEGPADFDCVVDDLEHPTILAVYNDAQALPEYKIVFKEK